MMKKGVFCRNVRKFAPKICEMKRFSLRLCALLAGVAVLASCLKNDDEVVYLSKDTAITQFTLGTLNRYTTSVSSKTGNDTVIKTTLTGSGYPMRIDHLNRCIYNTKTLPVGTDVKHVLCTVQAKNNGVVAVQSMVSDSLKFYSSSDSIDFSQPRIFRVYAADGTVYRDYTVRLDVSSEQGTTFGWELAQTMELPDYEPRLEAEGDSVMLGRESGVFLVGDTYYTIDPDDGLLKSRKKDAQDWQTETLDDDTSLLPLHGYAIVGWPYAMANETTYLLLVGAPRQEDEANMRVWRKLAPWAGGGQWVYMPFDDANRFPLLKMSHTLLAYYDGTVLSLGSDNKMRQSRDQGISWRKNNSFDLPATLTGEVISMAGDAKGRLWLLTSTGQLWRGFLSK